MKNLPENAPSSITDVVIVAHKNASEKGFWEYYDKALESLEKDDLESFDTMEATRIAFVCQKLLLINSEVVEAMEALRKGDIEEFPYELADIIIRTCDLAGKMNINLEHIVKEKTRINRNRSKRHGNNF